MSGEFGFSALDLHRHVVQFYDRDAELAQTAGNYLAGAIAEGGAAVVVATPGRCAEFVAQLAAGGVDVGAARRDGTLLSLDATRVAPGLARAGRIDLAAFRTRFRPAILAAGEAPGPVRIYGEVGALLWAAGQVNAALELEGLWNELGLADPVLAAVRLPAASDGRQPASGRGRGTVPPARRGGRPPPSRRASDRTASDRAATDRTVSDRTVSDRRPARR